jgi:molybdenum cofactor biosynthesis protein B
MSGSSGISISTGTKGGEVCALCRYLGIMPEFSIQMTGNISSVMSHNHIRPFEITGAVITVSMTRTVDTDTSGKTIVGLLEEKSISIRHYAIVPDRIDAIRNELFIAVKKANCIVINGGTGLTHDDCTIEAVSPLLEKRIEGFGEFFRMKSIQQIGTASMLSRAVAGIIGGKAVFCIPGSTPAVTLATTELILPEIAHIISHANR